jgi:acetyl esterase
MVQPVDPATDKRLDPRIKARQAAFLRDAAALLGDELLREVMAPPSNSGAAPATWAEMVAASAARSEKVQAKLRAAGLAEAWAELQEDDSPRLSARYRAVVEALSPGLDVSHHSCVSIDDDGNATTVPICFIRPSGDRVVPCVFYVHGGGMAAMSAMQGQFQAFGRLLARQGVAVCLPDFRNCLVGHESVPAVAEYPAGLNDCYSALQWINQVEQSSALHIGDVMVAGESGGGNLALALGLRAVQRGTTDALMPAGIFSLCPYIAATWPRSVTDDGILGTSHIENKKYMPLPGGTGSALGYSITAYDATDPQAWPGFATNDDLRGLPRLVISVNECDPLRDEGVCFYRRCLEAGVDASCRMVMGTTHAADMQWDTIPDVALQTVRAMADHASHYDRTALALLPMPPSPLNSARL